MVAHPIKSITIAASIIMIGMLISPLRAYAEDEFIGDISGLTIEVNGDSDTTVYIEPSVTEGREILYLPSSVNLHSITFVYDEGQLYVSTPGESDTPVNPKRILESGKKKNIFPHLSEDIGDGSRILPLTYIDSSGLSHTGELYVMKSSRIPTIYIISSDKEHGRGYIESSKENKASGNITMITANGDTIYNGGLGSIKCRGNNTFMADKKPYQIKLEKSANLLGTDNEDDSDKTWLLLANARDASLVRNSIAMYVASAMGLYTPEYRPVDLFYDGEYHGNYLLCEKIEIGKGRLDIYELEKKNVKANKGVKIKGLPVKQGKNKYGDNIQFVDNMKDPKDITKGYLIELDRAYYQSERSWFVLSDGTQFAIKYPENCSQAEVEYISDYMEEGLQAILNGGVNPNTGKDVWSYFDKDSMVKYYLLQEFTDNYDAYASSGYMYLNETGGPIISGPAWDFDTSFGIGEEILPVDGLRCTSDWIPWIYRITELSDFMPAAQEYFTAEGVGILSTPHMSRYVDEIADSQKLERIFCNRSDQSIFKQDSYVSDLAYLRYFLVNRLKWMKMFFLTT